MKFKDLPLIERPRQKLVRYGPDRLSTVELLAVILNSGNKKESVIQLSHKVLRIVSGDMLIYCSIDKLINLTGIGVTKASLIIACLELGKRLLKNKQFELILSPQDVWNQLGDVRDQRREHFVAFYLDIRNQIIKKDIISIGTLNASLVHPREVFEPAIRDGAAQIILCHNHPSGVVEPSDQDIELTKRLIAAGEILGIQVLDHIVVSRNGFMSFKEQGLI